MGNRIYGCDDCLAVCPWNRFAHEGRDHKLRAREDLAAPHLASLAALDDAGFRALFSASPVKRIGRARFVRNVLNAIGNSGDPALREAAAAGAADPDPIIADSGAWALARLAGTAPPRTAEPWANEAPLAAVASRAVMAERAAAPPATATPQVAGTTRPAC